MADHDHGDWRWIPFVLARAYAALQFGGWHDLIPDDKRNTDEPYAVASWRYLVEALRRDPEFVPARRWMIGLMVAGGDRLLIEERRAMLEREVARLMADPDALHALPLPDGTLVYPIQYRVVAWERATGRTIALDTAREFPRAAPRPAH